MPQLFALIDLTFRDQDVADIAGCAKKHLASGKSAATLRAMDIRAIRKDRELGSLNGHMLIAMPGMEDPRFARSVIYLCAHSSEGAMGLVINRRSHSLTFPELLVQLNVISETQSIRLPSAVSRFSILAGGPVEPSRGFVLHSQDKMIEEVSIALDDDIGLTISIDMLRAIARGEGPNKAVLALGYAGWSAGQLDQELNANSWLVAPADADLVFSANHDNKYDRALKNLGIDPAFLSMEAGHG